MLIMCSIVVRILRRISYMIYIWRTRENATYFGWSKNFENKNFNHENFQAVREWLKGTIELSKLAYKNRETAKLSMKTESKAAEIKTRTRHLECYIHEWER